SVGQSAGQARLEPPGLSLDHSRRVRARTRASAPAHRAGAGEAACRFHRQRTGLRAAPAKSGKRSQPSVAEAFCRRSQRQRPFGWRFDESGDGSRDHGARLALDQGTNANFDFLAADHHAGGGVLPDLRLGPHGERGRQPNPLPQRDTVRRLGHDIDATISAYVRGQSGVCLILGSYYAVGLTLAGLSFGLLIGVVSGLISFIPYVGSLTALVLSLAVAVAQFFPEWAPIVIVAAVVLVGQFLEGN